MKTYRSLLCLSTKNHNILYFLKISGINFPNTAICLWKARKPQAGSGFGRPNLPQFRCRPLALRPRCPKSKASPRRERGQEEETVRIGGGFVEMWRLGDGMRTSLVCGGRRPLLLEMRLGRNHLLVQDAHDQQLAGVRNVENNMLANLKPAQSGRIESQDRPMSGFWARSSKPSSSLARYRFVCRHPQVLVV